MRAPSHAKGSASIPTRGQLDHQPTAMADAVGLHGGYAPPYPGDGDARITLEQPDEASAGRRCRGRGTRRFLARTSRPKPALRDRSISRAAHRATTAPATRDTSKPATKRTRNCTRSPPASRPANTEPTSGNVTVTEPVLQWCFRMQPRTGNSEGTMTRLILITQHTARRANAIAAIFRKPDHPTLVTQDEWERRLIFYDDAGYCLDAVEPAQGSHEAYSTSTFTHTYREHA